MKLSEIKNILPGVENLVFRLENGQYVPGHFHITEVGMIHKHFIDCGGVIREEQVANFQLWNANDYDHMLEPGKLLRIIQIAEEKLGMTDSVIEVEYQLETIGKFNLDFDGKEFILTNKATACLASDACGIMPQKQRLKLTTLTNSAPCCGSDATCC